MSTQEGYFRRRLLRPILDLLRQGVTPEKIALSLALGIALGVFPAVGTTTILCALAALVLRLNLPAIQIVNYFAYPLQLALLFPFFRAGEWLFGAQHLALAPAQVYAMAKASVWDTTVRLWSTVWHAMIVWCIAAPVFVAIVYLVLTPILRRILHRQQHDRRAA